MTVRKYSEESARIGRINFTVLLNAILLEIFIILGLAVQSGMGKEKGDTNLQKIITLILSLAIIINWILYLKDKNETGLKFIISGGFIIGYTCLVLTSKSDHVVVYVYPLLIAAILYYDLKYMIIGSAYMSILLYLLCNYFFSKKI